LRCADSLQSIEPLEDQRNEIETHRHDFVCFDHSDRGFYPDYRGIGAVTQVPPADLLTHDRPRVEVVFVLDTSGSMGGLIQAAKEKICSIATTMASAQSAPEIRMGLVAYRDRGDDFVDLSPDLDSLYASLMDLQAAGGGDGPQSVNQALHDAIHDIPWGQDPWAYKVVFLVGDAPPHTDYKDDAQYPDTLVAATQMGIVVNAIQCGRNVATAREWRRMAQLGGGRYFRVEQAGSAVAIATPFDERLAERSKRLDETRLYYGSAEEKAKQQRKLEAGVKLHAGSSLASRARRAAFNASASGGTNLLGEGELVDDVVSGRVDLSSIDRDRLPAPMQPLAPAEREALIAETAKHRDALQREIRDLARQRSQFISKKVEALGGTEDSLDHKIYSAVREHAGKTGLLYEAAAPAY
jgi:Mg-chelatase subunit ChlD